MLLRRQLAHVMLPNSTHADHRGAAGMFMRKCTICGERQLYAKKMIYDRSSHGYMHKRCMKTQASSLKSGKKNDDDSDRRRARATAGNDAAAGRRQYLSPLHRPDRFGRADSLAAQHSRSIASMWIPKSEVLYDIEGMNTIQQPTGETINESYFPSPRALEVTAGNRWPVAVADNRLYEDHTAAGRLDRFGRVNPFAPLCPNDDVNFARRAEASAANERAVADNRRSAEDHAAASHRHYLSPFVPAVTDVNHDTAAGRLDRFGRANPFAPLCPNDDVNFARRAEASAANERADRRHYQLSPFTPAATAVAKEDHETREKLEQRKHQNVLVEHCSYNNNILTRMEQKFELLKASTDLKIKRLMEKKDNEKQRIQTLTDLIDTMGQNINTLMAENDEKEQAIRKLKEISPETSTPCNNCGFLPQEPSERRNDRLIEHPVAESADVVHGHVFPMAERRSNNIAGPVPFDMIARLVPATWAEFVAVTVNDAMAQGWGDLGAGSELRYANGVVTRLNVFVTVSLIQGNRSKIRVDVTEEDPWRRLRLRFVIAYDAHDGHYRVIQSPVDGDVEVARNETSLETTPPWSPTEE